MGKKPTPRYFMRPIRPHQVHNMRNPGKPRLFIADFYGPELKDEWGWFRAWCMVHNMKEAKERFQEWIDETEAYIEREGIAVI